MASHIVIFGTHPHQVLKLEAEPHCQELYMKLSNLGG